MASKAERREPGEGQGRSRTGLLTAYVLNQVDWSESSLILDLFTLEKGRLTVAAKGAKRPYSQLHSVLLPFQRLHIGLGKAPLDSSAEVFNLRQAEWAALSPMPTGSALFSAYYLNELLLKCLPRQDPDERLFALYEQTLLALSGADSGRATSLESAGRRTEQGVLRAFELALLREMGVLPELDAVTTTQQPLLDGSTYGLVPSAGLLPAKSDAALPAPVWRSLEAALRDWVPTAGGAAGLADLQGLCQPVSGTLRAILRPLIDDHLGVSQLKSRRVLQGVQRLSAYARQVAATVSTTPDLPDTSTPIEPFEP
jgi:DNA repair protein RecO (recombination protein O)